MLTHGHHTIWNIGLNYKEMEESREILQYGRLLTRMTTPVRLTNCNRKCLMPQIS